MHCGYKDSSACSALTKSAHDSTHPAMLATPVADVPPLVPTLPCITRVL
jgi:hypothetical protein